MSSQVPAGTAIDPERRSAPLARGAAMDSENIPEGTRYVPSGRSGPGALPRLTFSGLMGGLIVGLVYFGVTRFFNLLILFPLVAGAGAGFFVGAATTKAKVRNLRLAGAVGLLAAVLAFGCNDILEARAARSQIVDAIAEDVVASITGPGTIKDGKPVAAPAPSAKELQAAHDVAESVMTPWRTLVFYERAAAASGTSLSHNGSRGVTVSGGWYWLLHIGELIAFAITGWAVALGFASSPFCEACELWQKDGDVLKVNPVQNPRVFGHIRARDWTGLLGTEVGKTTDSKNLTTVKVSTCPNCGRGTLEVSSTSPVPDEFKRFHISAASVRSLRPE